MKSKYPNQIDTSAEIPVIRNNITEISADTFNSLRSAIIQIEKVLGINPQGSIGFTVGDRISQSLDSSGNLSREALERANVLYGQVVNDNVAKTAAIEESKLKLNIPTQILQSEISGLNYLIDSIVSKIDELNILFSIHINPAATNRHPALAISVSSYAEISSDISQKSFESDNLQTVIEDIYTKHINYSGSSISETNNSHLASQVYFDNTNISDITSSSDVQGAIEDISELNAEVIRDNFSYLNSNSLIRFGKKTNLYEDNRKNHTLISSSSAIFYQSSNLITNITLSTPIESVEIISQYDILILSGTTESQDDGEFYIESVELNAENKVISINIYSQLTTESNGTAIISVYKNYYEKNNENGFNSTIRPRYSYTNTPDVVIAHPNAATIVSSGINPSKITSSINKFKITADESIEIEIEAYDSSLSFDLQTLDSIVFNINKQFVENGFPALAYKIKKQLCYELAISHYIPDYSGDILKRSLKISSSSSMDATTELGFNSIIDVIYYGNYGNPLFINGVVLKDFYKIITFTNSSLFLNPGSSRLSLNAGSFLDYSISVGDTVVISNAEDNQDNVAFRILSINSENADLDTPSTYVFSGDINDNSLVFIIKNSIQLSDLNFIETSETNGLILVDALFEKNGNLIYGKRAEISQYISSGGIFASVIDISKGYLLNKNVTLTITTGNEAYLTDPDTLQDGEKIIIANTGEYNLRSPQNNGYLTIRVSYSSPVAANSSCTIYGFSESNVDIFSISRLLFGPSIGRVFGTTGFPGVPNLIDKRIFGNIGPDQVSSVFIERYIEQPRNDLRGKGIIYGCQALNISNSSDLNGNYVTFDISAGIFVFNGIRYIFDGIIAYKLYTDVNFYIGFDKNGCLDVREENTNSTSASYISEYEILYLAYINNISNIYVSTINNDKIFDLRYFIDKIDNKISKEIIVSNKSEDGHFLDIDSAIKYASFRYKINYSNNLLENLCPSIYIREGTFVINKPILVDIDLQISGSGSSTLLKRGDDLKIGSTINPYTGGTNLDALKAIFVIGGGVNTKSDKMFRGVSFKNFSYETNINFSGIAPVFCITQNLDSSGETSYFRFENLYFQGPTNLSRSGTDLYEIPIVATQSLAGSYPTNSIFGNIVVTGCYFNFMGGEDGMIDVIVNESSGSGNKIQNIICTNNIATNCSPDSIITPAQMIYDNYSAYVTLSNLIESSNAIND
jgi:hypothetical protein